MIFKRIDSNIVGDSMNKVRASEVFPPTVIDTRSTKYKSDKSAPASSSSALICEEGLEVVT